MSGPRATGAIAPPRPVPSGGRSPRGSGGSRAPYRSRRLPLDPRMSPSTNSPVRRFAYTAHTTPAREPPSPASTSTAEARDLEVEDALAGHLFSEVRVADGQLRDRTTLRTVEPRCRGRDSWCGTAGRAPPQPPRVRRPPRSGRRPDIPRERTNWWWSPAGRTGRDDQVTKLHAGLEGATGADLDEGGSLDEREDLPDHDLDVVRADASGHA